MNDEVIFWTPGSLDPKAFMVMGLSVKKSDSPIGYFGTGLKYAIAIILRNGGEIEIETEGERYCLGTVEESFRGEKTTLVTCNKQNLGYTTELGKTWELWQAYRELYCNTIDEGGAVVLPEEDDKKKGTRITVTSPKFFREHEKRYRFILSGAPEFENSYASFHRNPNVPKGIFYKGILVACPDEPMMFSYNIKKEVELSEDRSLDQWNAKFKISDAWGAVEDRHYVKEFFLNREKKFESTLPFRSYQPFSEKFLREASSINEKYPGKIPSDIKIAYKNKFGSQMTIGDFVPSDLMKKKECRAVEFCKKSGYPVSNYPIKYSKCSDPSIKAWADHGKITLTESAFESTTLLASCLLEEYFHLEHGFNDETRSFQNFLFEQLMKQMEISSGTPL